MSRSAMVTTLHSTLAADGGVWCSPALAHLKHFGTTRPTKKWKIQINELIMNTIDLHQFIGFYELF